MKFTISESKWHGCRYQVVELEQHTLWQINWNELDDWCKTTFGNPGDPWKPVSCRWYYNNGKLWFRKDADLTAFVLKWS